jgi:tetratricopeptide (TPR) repeat protein
MPCAIKREDYGSIQEYGVASKDAGNALFKEGLFEQALESYEATVCQLFEGDKEDPEIAKTCTQCKSNAALCALRLERWEQALLFCDDALVYHTHFSPTAADKAKVFYRRGQAHEGLEQFGEAIAAFDHAIEEAGTPAMAGALKRAKRSLKSANAGSDPEVSTEEVKFCTCPLCGLALQMDSEEACIEHMSSCGAFQNKFSGNPDSSTQKKEAKKKKKDAGASKNPFDKKAEAEADFFKPLPVQDDPDLKGAVNPDGTPVSAEELKNSVDLWNPKEVASVQAARVSAGLQEACSLFKSHPEPTQALESIAALETLLKFSTRGGGMQTHRARTLSTADPFFQKHDECPGFRSVLLAVGYVQADEILQFLQVEHSTEETNPEWAKDQVGMLTGNPTAAGARALAEALKQLATLRTELQQVQTANGAEKSGS